MTWRSACGITISAVVFPQDRPSALAASPCPRGIACRPPRIDLGLIGAGEQRDADQRAHQIRRR